MPKFADVFDLAAQMAEDVQAYEALHLMTADEGRRPAIEEGMSPTSIREYDHLMRTAYFQCVANDLRSAGAIL